MGRHSNWMSSVCGMERKTRERERKPTPLPMCVCMCGCACGGQKSPVGSRFFFSWRKIKTENVLELVDAHMGIELGRQAGAEWMWEMEDGRAGLGMNKYDCMMIADCSLQQHQTDR